MFNRVFLLVLDGLGVGEAKDAKKYGDSGSNTLLHTIGKSYNLDVLEKLGLTKLIGYKEENIRGLYMKANPVNKLKDSLNGHYELMGCISNIEYKTYPNGFPIELIEEIEKSTHRTVIGNIASDGEILINQLGDMQIEQKAIIIYTSCDSVLQVAAHEDIIPVEELYKICEKIRFIVDKYDYKIGRIIARPFTGKNGRFIRTGRRKDFSLEPPRNVLDVLYENHIQTICIGKIGDMFSNKSISYSIKTKDNIDTMLKVVDFAKGEFEGLVFANFNDFDSLYGHRRDKEGYLKALEEFNYYLPILLKKLKKDDLLIITADHGNDPTHEGSDHTREKVPVLIYNKKMKTGKMLEERNTFADVGATILDNFNLQDEEILGTSIFKDIKSEN
ncbi:MAG: phosphopentomutase [Bacilli bacterium]|nr:phosphopentomutase [Bacilli bacterium]